MWIDFDRDGVWDTDEPPIPETPVIAEYVGAGQVSGQSVEAMAAVANIALRTDASGRFAVPQLEPGSWKLTAQLNTASLEKVFDSGGALDWVVNAIVPVNGVGEGDFAAAGNSGLVAPVLPAGTSAVEVTWEGVDQSFETPDDVEFELVPENGRLQASGLPSGDYRMIVRLASGTTVEVAATLISGNHRLDVSARKVTSIDLPATGARPDLSVLFAVLSIVCGALLLRRVRPAR